MMSLTIDFVADDENFADATRLAAKNNLKMEQAPPDPTAPHYAMSTDFIFTGNPEDLANFLRDFSWCAGTEWENRESEFVAKYGFPV